LGGGTSLIPRLIPWHEKEPGDEARLAYDVVMDAELMDCKS